MKRAGAALLLLVGAAQCGYRALGPPQGSALAVHLERSQIPDAIAADEVVSGVRVELSREGLLAAGDRFPRVEVEILRIDEASDAIAAAEAPRARALRVAVVGRAWIAPEPGARAADTGDVRATEGLGVPTGSERGMAPEAAAAVEHEAAVRAAARRLGQKLARRLLGMPAITEDG